MKSCTLALFLRQRHNTTQSRTSTLTNVVGKGQLGGYGCKFFNFYKILGSISIKIEQVLKTVLKNVMNFFSKELNFRFFSEKGLKWKF